MSSWLNAFLEGTKDAEAPTNYFYWSGLAALSAAVGNRVYINKQLFKVYPNLFVFLISKSSGLGKGVPVNACKKVLQAAGTTRLIIGQNSIEGIIKELSQAFTTDSGRIINTAEAMLIAGEFGSFLLDNQKLFTNLTDLYDSQYNEGDWNKRLASKDTAKLEDLCISGLFAANEVHFREALPVHAIKGGFLGRSICIYESKRRKLDDLLPVEGENRYFNLNIYQELGYYLRTLVEIKGEFKVSRMAALAYRQWYQSFYDLENELRDDTGTAERLRDTILKVAMLLSLAEGKSLIIEDAHMTEAMWKCNEVYKSTTRMVIGEGKSSNVLPTKAVLKILLAKPDERISKSSLLQRGLKSGDFDVHELDRVLDHLSQSRIIKIDSDKGGPWITPIVENINKLFELVKDKKG